MVRRYFWNNEGKNNPAVVLYHAQSKSCKHHSHHCFLTDFFSYYLLLYSLCSDTRVTLLFYKHTKMLLSKGLCAGCFLCIEHAPFPNTHKAYFLDTLLKFHFLEKATMATHLKCKSPNTHTHHFSVPLGGFFPHSHSGHWYSPTSRIARHVPRTQQISVK